MLLHWLMLSLLQDTYIQSRADTMKNIEQTIVELGSIFQQLAHMVKEQEEVVQRWVAPVSLLNRVLIVFTIQVCHWLYVSLVSLQFNDVIMSVVDVNTRNHYTFTTYLFTTLIQLSTWTM